MSNRGGIAVSGEVTLHADDLYVQVSQSTMGSDAGILFRSCKGRHDYTGGQNHVSSLDLLNDPVELARVIRQSVPAGGLPVTTTAEKRETPKIRVEFIDISHNDQLVVRYFHTEAGDAKEFVDSLKNYNDRHDNIYRDIKIIDTSTIEAEGTKWTRTTQAGGKTEETGEAKSLKDAPINTTSSNNSAEDTSPVAAVNDAHRRYFDDKEIVINSAADAVNVFRELLQTEDAIDRDKEHFYVMHLDIRSKVKMVEVVSVGTLSASYVHPRETFRRAIVEGADKIIVAHNHPSGEVSPSEDDIQTTKLLHEAGGIVNIQMVDHIIFSTRKAFSFRKNKEI